MNAVAMIEEAGFSVLEAANADEAIHILETRRDVTVIFTDIEMPGSMNGIRLPPTPSETVGRQSSIIATSGAITDFKKAICRPAADFYPKP